jgi:hypothetical protein
MKMRNSILASLLLAIAALASCAQPFKVTGAWNEGATRPQSFKRLLIIGVSPDYSARCNFEYALATTLRSNAVKAIASCSAMTAEEQLNRENVVRVVASLGIDGVLVSRLVAASASVKEGGSHDMRSTHSYKATAVGYDYYNYGYGSYGMPVIYGEFAGQLSIFSLEHEFEIGTQLYETRGASVVYSLKTKAKSQESRNIIIAEISAGIAARLRQARLIQ